jgi:hypothetical protein
MPSQRAVDVGVYGSGRLNVGFDVADLADQAIRSRRGGEAVMLVELAGVVVYSVDDDVPAARLLARRHRAGKGVVQQDPAQAGAEQLAGQGEPGQEDRGDRAGPETAVEGPRFAIRCGARQ